MQPGKGRGGRTGQLLERGDHRLVPANDDQLLSFISPPTVGVREVADERAGLLIEHAGSRPGLELVVNNPVDPSLADILVQPVGGHHTPQIGTPAHPITFLDNAPVHVEDIETAIGTGLRRQRPEVGILRGDEFSTLVGIHQHGLAGDVGDLRPANEPSYSLGNEQIAAHILGQSIASIDTLPAAAGEVIQRIVGSYPTTPALHIRHVVNRKHLPEAGRQLSSHTNPAVDHGLLEIHRRLLAAGGGVIELPDIIMGQPPLARPSGQAVALGLPPGKTIAMV